ncbi:uncharacterized protein LOC106151288 [Lingula anatina]|uniref:Uncharacterized protein LOC106151288 n=1 Tax=Lingula anatina TaxID=7574 RepID=A0A1S3H1A8_LINAN|nr:uncharacterized protein LOC106151288 [Lingula anatina]|eukprot:XP_013379920.1 uncharacterized protein LOC106151288 [Lingula anatina]
MDIPAFVGYTNDNSTSLFSACVSTAPVGTLPLSCGDNTRCVTNPLFSVITRSTQACLCPLTSYPSPNGTCQTITGTPCQVAEDCEVKSIDCIGVTGWGLDAALTQFVASFVLALCRITVEYNYQIPVWTCTPSNQCDFIGLATPSTFTTVGRRKREVNEPPEAVEEDHGARITESLSRITRSETESDVKQEVLSVGEVKKRPKRGPTTFACTPSVLLWANILTIFGFGGQSSVFEFTCEVPP